MSKTETIRARIEPELKHNAETVLAALGLSVTEACLLYTSPSPRDAHESRMPSSA